jgi:hypothetical protein
MTHYAKKPNREPEVLGLTCSAGGLTCSICW